VITITGQQFQSGAIASLVRDGTVQQLATTYISPATLRATVPAGLQPGTYALRVVNPGGAQDTLLAAFTVLAPTPPTITGLNPQQGPNNMPVTVDIYGSNFAPGLNAQLGTFALEGLYFINSTHIRASVPINIPTGVYTLTVTNPNGQFARLANAYTALEGIDDLLPREGSFW
ncbi:MAG: IPT/TIG domain-containing protein, partial [Anaerolineae bacterium]|nr:IPT/TIG domain-containing protein [Anaerolineae bacterium]